MTARSTVAKRVGEALAELGIAHESRTETVVVAVSGGADSVCLLNVLREIPELHLIAAHLSHGVRSRSEEENDVRLVKEHCGRLEVALLAESTVRGRVADLARSTGSGIEAAARQVRYDFLCRAAKITGSRWVATAHSEDDQMETVILSIERGVHPMMLSGIPQTRMLDEHIRVVRPLLDVSRSDIRTYLRDRGLAWSEDSTNADEAIARNRVRRAMAELEPHAPGIRRALLSLAGDARARRMRASGTAPHWSVHGDTSWTAAEGFFASSDDSRLAALFSEAQRRGVIRPSSRISVDFFAPLLGEGQLAGREIRSRGQHIHVSDGKVLWQPDIVHETDSGYLRVAEPDVPIVLSSGRRVRVTKQATTADNHGVIDLGAARLPVVVRVVRPGDVIQTKAGRRSVASVVKRSPGRPGLQRVSVVADRKGIVCVLLPDSVVWRETADNEGWRVTVSAGVN